MQCIFFYSLGISNILGFCDILLRGIFIYIIKGVSNVKENITRYKARDGKMIALYRWEPDDKSNIKGLIQLIHGSCEHSGRYRAFSEFLNENGYVVYSNDHRGHGLTAVQESELGFIGENDGWKSLVDDVLEINKILRGDYPNLPVFMIGHSMGSFIARHYVTLYGDTIDGLVLSGTAHNNRLLLKFAIALADINIKLNGNRCRSKFINYLSYGAFNRKVSAHRTKFDWICIDEKVVDDYIKDYHCGYIFTSNAFKEMFRGLYYITDYKNIKKTPVTLPILLISGKKDVVGNEGKMVYKCYEKYKEAGIKNISIKLYENMRHEILNEIGKEEVYEDILNWIRKHLTID